MNFETLQTAADLLAELKEIRTQLNRLRAPGNKMWAGTGAQMYTVDRESLRLFLIEALEQGERVMLDSLEGLGFHEEAPEDA